MSITLILWKVPIVDHPEEATRLLGPYYERGEASAFESSPDIARVSNELRRRFPDVERGPWADGLPPKEVDRVLRLEIRRSADADVVNEIVELARTYDLVVYDPQGPSCYLPYPVVAGPIPRQSPGSYLDLAAMGLVAAAVFALGWWIQVPVLDWILMVVGGFFLTVILFLLGILVFRPEQRRR